MKFDLTSDLHLDFGGIQNLDNASNVGSDVLILAGDTVEAVILREKTHQCREIVEYLQALNHIYKKVIYIMGNHDHYHNSFIHTKKNLTDRFKEFDLDNFVMLEKETYEYEDTIFFGATMWTTFNNNNPIVMMQCQTGMNDYAKIHTAKIGYGEKIYLSPEDTSLQCRQTKKKIQQFIDLKTDKKKVLVTHMAPSAKSLNNSSRDNLNYAYYEELFEILVDSDIKIACHGHLHHSVDYLIGDCRVVSNPRGYYGHEPRAVDHKFLQIKV